MVEQEWKRRAGECGIEKEPQWKVDQRIQERREGEQAEAFLLGLLLLTVGPFLVIYWKAKDVVEGFR